MSLVTEDIDGGAPPSLDFRDLALPRYRPLILGGMAASAALMAVLGPAFQSVVTPTLSGPVAPLAAPTPKAAPKATAATAAAPIPLAPQGQALFKDLLAKAKLRPGISLEQLTWDQARKVNAVLPAQPLLLDAAPPFKLDLTRPEGKQALHCLTQAAYYEAGANGDEAESAVVQVVLNRLRHPDFPKSVCGVVYEGAARTSGCQFTFTCDGALNREIDLAAWAAAEKVARRALGGYVTPWVGASTYYHADYVFPAWATTLVKQTTVGPHIFYRMTGEAGRAAYLTGRYAGGELKVSKDVLYAIDALTQRNAAAGPGPAVAPAPADNAPPDGRIHVQLVTVAPAAPKLEVVDTVVASPAPTPKLVSVTPQIVVPSKPVYFQDPTFNGRIDPLLNH
jgi:spore germination cell wall hydrolase CwlJ-like protein